MSAPSTKRVLGHDFRPMTPSEWQGFAGADEGTLICVHDDVVLLHPRGSDHRGGCGLPRDHLDGGGSVSTPAEDITFALYDQAKQTFTHSYPTYEAYEASPDAGTEDLLVEVELLGHDHYRLAATQYYCKEGVFEMTITQPLPRALRTFAAALAMDTQVEMGVAL